MTSVAFGLTIIAGYVSLKLIGLTQNNGRLKYVGLAIASSIFVIMQFSVFIDGMIANPNYTAVSNGIVEWGHVVCLAFILSSLAVFVRESKPVFAQFPMLYTALPLLIVFSYFLVKDTYALKRWLLAIYQGGAILVSLLMYSVYTYRNNEYAMILTGVSVFLFSYLLYWYVPGVSEYYPWIWKLLVAIGMIVTILGYEKVEYQQGPFWNKMES
jgi:hypothetical protein